jgi:hypothetical protein
MYLQTSFPYISFHVTSVLGDRHFLWYMNFKLMVAALMYPHIAFVSLHANSV